MNTRNHDTHATLGSDYHISDFNDCNTGKSGNIYTPRLCYNGEMQRYTTFIEFYTCLDNDFNTLIENGNNFQFSQAVFCEIDR